MVNGDPIQRTARGSLHIRQLHRGILPMIMVLMLPCCGDELGPPRSAVLNVADYMWHGSNSELVYERSTSDRTVTHTLRFESGSITDTRTDAYGSHLSTSTLAYDCSSGGARLKGCGSLSLPYFPEHIVFEDQIYSIPGPEVHAGHWASLDNHTMLVADISGLLYRFDLQSRSWELESVPWTSAVVAIALDNSSGETRILCGTADDGLYMREDSDATWTRLQAPPGHFEGLVVSASGTLYAVIDGYLYQRSASTVAWEPFPISSLDDNVTSIAIFDLDKTRSMLLFGRGQSVLVHVLLVNSMPAQIMFPRSQTNETIIDLRCSATSAYPSVAIADPPMLLISTQSTGAWASVPLPGIARPAAVCQSDYGGTVLIGTEAGMYRFDGAPLRRSGLDGEDVRSLHCGPDRAFYCGTRNGTYRADDDGAHWKRIDRSPVFQRSASEFTLLPNEFSIGSSWDAAKVRVGENSGRRLIGRVVEHFDEFHLPNGGYRFTDVIAVRYAQEGAGGELVPGEYYWNVFYARGQGPVYFEELMDGVIQARTSLRKS